MAGALSSETGQSKNGSPSNAGETVSDSKNNTFLDNFFGQISDDELCGLFSYVALDSISLS